MTEILPHISNLYSTTDKTLWEKLIMKLIRPQKYVYNHSELGNKIFQLNKKTYIRQQIIIPHKEKKNLELSFIKVQQEKPHSVIVYLHGNSSCRLQCFNLLRVLPTGFGLASFDFLGCGITADEYISLGVRQSEQISTVVQFLEKQYRVILWGRSMGASSALIYGGTTITIVDSPFVNLKRVILQLAQNYKPKYIPFCLISCLFPCVYMRLRKDIESLADFDINCLDIKKYVQLIDPKKKLIFLSATNDQLINHKHSVELYQSFKGRNKNLILFQGKHNTDRDFDILNHTMRLIKQYVDKEISILEINQSSSTICP